jgi:hypothetical protein
MLAIHKDAIGTRHFIRAIVARFPSADKLMSSHPVGVPEDQ